MRDLQPVIEINFCAFAIFVTARLIHVGRDTRVVHGRLVYSYYVIVFIVYGFAVMQKR
jgi:hypothetical protein